MKAGIELSIGELNKLRRSGTAAALAPRGWRLCDAGLRQARAVSSFTAPA